MRNLSSEFKEQQNNGNRNYLKYADFTFTDGTTLSITDEDLWSNGLKFEDAVSQSGSFDIGAAIVNKLTLQINNFSGKFTDYIWDGARVVCYIGLEVSTGIEKVRICTMTVTDVPYQNTAIINLTCEDYMRKFDRDYSESKLTYPATRLQIIQDACEVCGVTLQSTRFDNDDFVIQNRPDDSSLTFRQVIAWVAQMGCQWAKCDEYGRLCLGWYESEILDKFYSTIETPWKDTEGNDILDTTGAQIITTMQKGITAIDTSGFTPWLYDVEITGVKVTEYVDNSSQNEAKTYQSGKSGYVIEISDNKLIQEGTGGTVCQIIADRCVGMKFRPFTTGALTNIAWEAGDIISISDRTGKQYKSYLTSVTLSPGNFEQLECSAKSVSRNSQKQYSLGQQIQSENKKNLRDERTAREKAIEDLSNRLAESSGVYTTVEQQQDGSNIYYLHNKPNLADSDIVWKMTAEAWAVSTDGGKTWNGGMTVDGDMIARILTATGVNADWLNTGTIKAVDKDGNVTFMVDITTGRVVINADSVKIKGKDVDAIAKEKAEAEVNDFISNTYTTDIKSLQSQIDGQIETFFYDYEPTLQNIPASDWTTNEERKKHEGDLFYWKSKGYAYRFMQDGTTWKWQLVQDTDIALALGAAEKAQDTADGKRRVFVVQPEPPYDIGDLWAQGSNGDLMRCKVARASGTYSASDWEKASKYTDDSSLNFFIDGVFKDSLNSLKTQIDGKIETWYQSTDPSLKWTKTEEQSWIDTNGNKILDTNGNEIILIWESEKAEHEGDLWHNTTDNTQWIYKSGVWMPQSIPDELLDKIDGKSSVYMVQPTPPYYKGDMWVTTDEDGKAALKTSTVNRVGGEFDASDWIDFKYADKNDIKKAIESYDTSLGQDEVFNKLTNGGKKQGLYIENGIVYVNAEYILAGLLAGERINARGLKVIDDDKKVTLEIDSKGKVKIAASQFTLLDKSISEITQDEIAKIPNSTDNILKGYMLTKSDINAYWDYAGTLSFDTLNPYNENSGVVAITANSSDSFLSAKRSSNQVVYFPGKYQVSVWLKSSVNQDVKVSLNREFRSISLTTEWKRYEFLQNVSEVSGNYQLFTIGGYGSFSTGTIEVYRPEITVAVNSEHIFNLLTNNGEMQGIFLKNGQLYVNGEYLQARGVNVVDSDGKTTFSIDKETGAVTLAAESFALGDKSIAEIAQEEIDKLPRESANLLLGSQLSEDDFKKRYWSIIGDREYSQSDPLGGANALKLNNLPEKTSYYMVLITNKPDNPISKSAGRYHISVWLKSSTITSCRLYFGNVSKDFSIKSTWGKYNWVVDSTSTSPDFRIYYISNGTGDLEIFQPEITFGYTDEEIFNMLTNNGAKQGIYMSGDQLYVNGYYIKALSIVSSAIAAKAITSDKISVSELAALSATIAGFAITNGAISKYTSDYSTSTGAGSGIIISSNSGANFIKLVTGHGASLAIANAGIQGDGNRLNIIPDADLKGDTFTSNKRNYFGKTSFGDDVFVSGGLTVVGTKSIVAETESYGNQAYYCYETPTPTLGDFGGGVIGEDGIAIISIDDIFRESTETEIEYYVFIQNEGEGQSWVSEKSDAFFIVKGTPGLRFAWELKAKQKNKEFIRFNAGKEDREVNFQKIDLENAMFGEREKIINEMEGELA